MRGRPAVAYDQQGLVFAVAMEGGAIKLFDSRSYDKVFTFKADQILLYYLGSWFGYKCLLIIFRGHLRHF